MPSTIDTRGHRLIVDDAEIPAYAVPVELAAQRRPAGEGAACD